MYPRCAICDARFVLFSNVLFSTCQSTGLVGSKDVCSCGSPNQNLDNILYVDNFYQFKYTVLMQEIWCKRFNAGEW